MIVQPLTPLAVPPQSCLPTTLQNLVNLLAQYLAVTFPQGYTQIIVSTTTPAPSDNDKIWLKTDAAGNPIGFYLFAGGAWVPINPPELYFTLDTGALNSVVVNIPNYPHTALVPGLFIIKVAVTNTGPATLKVNGFPSVPIKLGGVDPYAGAMVAGFTYEFTYTGSSFELLNPTVVVAKPFITANNSLTPLALPVAGTSITYAPPGITARPTYFTCELVCVTANNNYILGHRKLYTDVTGTSGGASPAEYPAYSLTCAPVAPFTLTLSRLTAAEAPFFQPLNGGAVVIFDPAQWQAVFTVTQLI